MKTAGPPEKVRAATESEIAKLLRQKAAIRGSQFVFRFFWPREWQAFGFLSLEPFNYVAMAPRVGTHNGKFHDLAHMGADSLGP